MAKTPNPNEFTKAELLKLVLELKAENERLRAELEILKRKQVRSTAPFSRNTPKKNPSPPGRKPGVGQFTFRTSPERSSITNTVDVPAPESCPKCAGPLSPFKTEFAFITDLPEIKPSITEYRVRVNRCPTCKQDFRGVHPSVASNQRGATADRLGPRALAAGHALQYDFGITARKVPGVLKMLTQLEVTQSALTQQALKHGANPAGVIHKKYETLRASVRAANMVNTDDTGWRINGANAFLMAFKTNSSVVYQIRAQHRSVDVLEVIPADFAGVLVTDRFVTYDAKVFQAVKQHKCVSHILKNLRDLLEKPQRGRSHEFLRKLRAVFKKALRLHQRFDLGLLEKAVFEREGRAVKRRLDRLLAPRLLSNKNNARMLRELAWHHARGSLLRFLDDPNVSPTNNAAERALRPAVIARKLSAGSKSERGALAFSSFKSVIETGKLSGVSGFKTLLGVYEDKR